MEREARYGFHTYAVKVSPHVEQSGVVHVHADSVTVSNGALMFAVEVETPEAMAADDAGLPPPAREQGWEFPPAFVFAPGHWFSVTLVDDDLKPFFVHGRVS